MAMPIALSMCARCVAGQCGHDECRSPGWGKPPVTDVAGTSCCADCAPVLLELVLHPPVTVVVNPPLVAGNDRTARPVTSSRWAGPVT